MDKSKEALAKTIKNLKTAIPIMAGVLMMVSIVNPFFSEYYSRVFTGNYFTDPLIGAIGGSIAFGIPITSYVVGGELLAKGVSLLAIAAFMLAWTTVGVAMLPLEISFLGKKFAIYRNIFNFFLAIIIAALTMLTLNIFNLV